MCASLQTVNCRRFFALSFAAAAVAAVAAVAAAVAIAVPATIASRPRLI